MAKSLNEKNEQMVAIFGVAEKVIQEWIGKLLNKNVKELFGIDYCETDPIEMCVPTNEEKTKYCRVSLKLVEPDYNIQVQQYRENKDLMDVIGYMFYCLKIVYIHVVKTLNNSIINQTGLNFDEDRDTYYMQYYHELTIEKLNIEHKISKLLSMKPPKKDSLWDKEWADVQILLNDIEKRIVTQRAEQLTEEYNQKFSICRVGINLKFDE